MWKINERPFVRHCTNEKAIFFLKSLQNNFIPEKMVYVAKRVQANRMRYKLIQFRPFQ